MTVEIRSLRPEDAGAFQALRLRGLRECPTAFASSYEEERGEPPAAVARRLAPVPGREIFGAFSGSVLAGVVGLQRETHRKLAHKAVLWGMYVAPEFRGRGIGRRLVARTLEHAFAVLGVRQVNLGVNAGNSAARALYESAGFEPYGLERGFLQVDGAFEDEILMVRFAKPPSPALERTAEPPAAEDRAR